MGGTNTAKIQNQAHLALHEAVESLDPRDQDRSVWECQFFQDRWEVAIKRLTALRQILHGW